MAYEKKWIHGCEVMIDSETGALLVGSALPTGAATAANQAAAMLGIHDAIDSRTTGPAWDNGGFIPLDATQTTVTLSVDEDTYIQIDSADGNPSTTGFKVYGQANPTLRTNGGTRLHFKQVSAAGSIAILGAD